ncbi:hypothetical protein [Streptomyces silvensis]|uniref:hypothetical protein n=1 Tax=Streptomyces silvensis TaxID=1765722 RepID=UPI000AEF2D16|nr:hypothetical protein [Streptomyces silvensis]
MTGKELTLGAVLARLEEQERELAVQAEATREQIAQLTARLDELGRAAEEVRITRKTLLALPDPQPPAPPTPKLPEPSSQDAAHRGPGALGSSVLPRADETTDPRSGISHVDRQERFLWETRDWFPWLHVATLLTLSR